MSQRDQNPFGGFDPLDLENERPETRRRAARAARTTPARGQGALFALALVGAGGVLAWWALGGEGEEPAPSAPVAIAPAAAPAGEPSLAPVPKEEQDARVREALSALSGDATLARWLQASDLVRRFVAGVAAVAEGESPVAQVRGVLPQDSFEVRRRGRAWVAHTRSYAGYTSFVQVFASIDPRAAAVAFEKLEPLLDAAYREIARPGVRFRHTFGEAIAHLTATPIPEGRVELVERGIFHAYVDPQLESLSKAQKQLLRMGPENARRVQTQLRAIAAALHVGQEEAAAHRR